MIWDSLPWKRELTRLAESLRRRKSQRRWPGSSLARVEQEIFLSAYVIRKLLDSNKVSDEVASSSLRGRAHKHCSGTVDIMNWHKIDELYDLSSGEEISLGLRDFCNQIIHSFVFVLAITNGLEGFYVASDRDKSSRLLYFDIDEVINTLVEVSEDDIVRLVAIRGTDGEMKLIKKSNRLKSDE